MQNQLQNWYFFDVLGKMVHYLEHYVQQLFLSNLTDEPISTDRCITIILKYFRTGKIDLGFVNFLQKFLECFKFYCIVFIEIILFI